MNNINPNSHGGSELVARALLNKIPQELTRGINLILNTTQDDLVKKNAINIVWNQHNTDQNAVLNLKNKLYLDSIDCFVYVSHWQYEKYRYKFNIPEYKSVVIKNATDEFPYQIKPKKIKLIYTSTPWRGLEILLDAFENLGRDDVELDIYSSTIIYGKEFDRNNKSRYEELFDRARSVKNINYLGFKPNPEIREALLKAHIFSYPCIWEETSCISAIEAGMAGLNLVTTNLGALYETCGAWAKYVEIDSNLEILKLRFTHALNKSIDNYWKEENQKMLVNQSDYFNAFYGWKNRIQEWVNLFSQLQKFTNKT
jgi:glycosyltransferase involved in cell wall biosynthesis